MVKDGYEFVSGKIYFIRQLDTENSDTFVYIYKGGGGIVSFSEDESKNFFIKVILVKCKENIEQGDETVFRKGSTYYVSIADKEGDFIIYECNVANFFTHSMNYLKKFFEIVPE
ncbi:MAG: hypothetical protein ACNFW9_00815 [Candidatus Kerfeldbacteria bacterium]